MSDSAPAALEPVDDDGVRAVSVGLVVWAVAAVACLLWREDLAERGADWWLWSCLVGLGFGLGMLLYMRRRAAVYRAHRAAGGSSGDESPERDAG
jgi:hypothetical protein